VAIKCLTCVVVLTVACAACHEPGPSSDRIGASVDSSQRCDVSEPENPYNDGTGHYAGFAWAEQNDPTACGGNSSSFIEGCQEFLRQSAAYEACVDAR